MQGIIKTFSNILSLSATFAVKLHPMKRLLLKMVGIIAICAVSEMASAEYVCSVIQFPSDANTVPYRLRVQLSTAMGCGGTKTYLWFCEKDSGQTLGNCAVNGLRFGKSELIEMYGQLVRAADTQQQVVRDMASCADGSNNFCGYSVEFYN